MNRVIYVCVPVALMATMLSATEAGAQTNSWSVSFDVGTQVAVRGDVHGSGAGRVLGLPTQVESRSYSDVYGDGLYWAAGLGYRLGETGELRVQGSYTSNPAERLQVGSVAGLPLFALFDDYRDFGMNVGYRQYLGSARVRPYVGGSIGFERLEEIKSEFSVPAAGVVLSDVDFYKASVVPSFGIGGGVQISLSDSFAVQGGIDFKWQGDAKDSDGLAGTGLDSINDESRRWSMPLTAGVTVRF
jgi:hypothetical protein